MSQPEQRREFAFLVRCCSANFPAGPSVRANIPNDLDWNRYVRLAQFHRVQGLAWNALSEDSAILPDGAMQALRSGARSIAATNLAIAAECAALRLEFARAGLPLMFVKGLTVGALVYRKPMLKMSWDIDLLIDPRDLEPAARTLSGRGFALRLPGSADRLATWHCRHKESVWSRKNGLNIELHTRLTENSALVPGLTVHSPAQEVEILSGLSLPTLARDELFAYLCVHGASSAWFRLKWISDFAGLLAGQPAQEIERLYRRSQDLGAARAAAQALLLADRLFGTLAEAPAIRQQLQADRSSRLLAAIALRQLTGREEPAEPTEQSLGTLAIHYSQLFLRKGLGFKLGEAIRQLRSALA